MILMRVRTTLLFLLLLLSCLLSLQSAQLPPDAVISACLLDANLQDWAFKALSRPITGVPYDGQVPTNLKGIKVSAMRLRSGSLRARGVPSYKEFEIPIGVIEDPHVERLVLVYHNLGNWSDIFYPLHGYSYLAPVLGLLGYGGSNLSGSELPELDMRASKKPILIHFPEVGPAPLGSVAKCVHFDLHGSVHFDIVLPGNVCSTFQQGHFAIVVESDSIAPSPSGEVQDGGKKNKTMVRIVVPCVVGGILLLIILGLLAVGLKRFKQKSKMQELECKDDGNEILDMASIGGTKLPLAFGTRTKPMIEHDYFP